MLLERAVGGKHRLEQFDASQTGGDAQVGWGQFVLGNQLSDIGPAPDQRMDQGGAAG